MRRWILFVKAALLLLQFPYVARSIEHNLPPGLEIVDPKSLGLSDSDLEKFLGNVKLLPVNGGDSNTQILTVGFDGDENLNVDDFEQISTDGLKGQDKSVAESAFNAFKQFFKTPQKSVDFDRIVDDDIGGSRKSEIEKEVRDQGREIEQEVNQLMNPNAIAKFFNKPNGRRGGGSGAGKGSKVASNSNNSPNIIHGNSISDEFLESLLPPGISKDNVRIVTVPYPADGRREGIPPLEDILKDEKILKAFTIPNQGGKIFNTNYPSPSSKPTTTTARTTIKTTSKIQQHIQQSQSKQNSQIQRPRPQPTPQAQHSKQSSNININTINSNEVTEFFNQPQPNDVQQFNQLFKPPREFVPISTIENAMRPPPRPVQQQPTISSFQTARPTDVYTTNSNQNNNNNQQQQQINYQSQRNNNNGGRALAPPFFQSKPLKYGDRQPNYDNNRNNNNFGQIFQQQQQQQPSIREPGKFVQIPAAPTATMEFNLGHFATQLHRQNKLNKNNSNKPREPEKFMQVPESSTEYFSSGQSSEQFFQQVISNSTPPKFFQQQKQQQQYRPFNSNNNNNNNNNNQQYNLSSPPTPPRPQKQEEKPFKIAQPAIIQNSIRFNQNQISSPAPTTTFIPDLNKYLHPPTRNFSPVRPSKLNIPRQQESSENIYFKQNRGLFQTDSPKFNPNQNQPKQQQFSNFGNLNNLNTNSNSQFTIQKIPSILVQSTGQNGINNLRQQNPTFSPAATNSVSNTVQVTSTPLNYNNNNNNNNFNNNNNNLNNNNQQQQHNSQQNNNYNHQHSESGQFENQNRVVSSEIRQNRQFSNQFVLNHTPYETNSGQIHLNNPTKSQSFLIEAEPPRPPSSQPASSNTNSNNFINQNQNHNQNQIQFRSNSHNSNSDSQIIQTNNRPPIFKQNSNSNTNTNSNNFFRNESFSIKEPSRTLFPPPPPPQTSSSSPQSSVGNTNNNVISHNNVDNYSQSSNLRTRFLKRPDPNAYRGHHLNLFSNRPNNLF